jgi:hypothetical protein
MAAAKDQCSGAIERVEQSESLGVGRRSEERWDQEKRGEESKRDGASSPRDRKIQIPGMRRDFPPAEPKACARAERDRRDLPERSGEKNNDRRRGKRDAGAGAIGCEGSRHAPDRLRDDRDSH